MDGELPWDEAGFSGAVSATHPAALFLGLCGSILI